MRPRHLSALTPVGRPGGRALDARYPEALDEAINAALAPLRAGSAEAPERGRAEGGRERASAPDQARRIAGFVAAALERGLRAPLGAAGGGAAGGAEPNEARAAAGFTVQRAIDAPAAELRILVRTRGPLRFRPARLAAVHKAVRLGGSALPGCGKALGRPSCAPSWDVTSCSGAQQRARPCHLGEASGANRSHSAWAVTAKQPQWRGALAERLGSRPAAQPDLQCSPTISEAKLQRSLACSTARPGAQLNQATKRTTLSS